MITRQKMKLPRPKRDLGEPQQQHVVAAMLILLHMADPRDRVALETALVAAVERMWGWDAERFEDELGACKRTLVEAGSRLTCWFTVDRMEVDVHVPQ